MNILRFSPSALGRLIPIALLAIPTFAYAAAEEFEVLAETAAFAPTSDELDRALTQAITDPARACEYAYLKSVGWRTVESISGKVEIVDGNPCNRGSLKASQTAGELTIGLPARPSGQEMAEVIRYFPELLKAGSTLCGYKHLVSDAAKRAIGKLQANPQYQFTDRNEHTGFMDLGKFQGLRMGWRPLGSLLNFSGHAYRPAWSNSTAIRSIYEKPARMECAAGLQLSEHAIQYELYGDEDYDRAFARDEIVVGIWNKVSASNSAIHGQKVGREKQDSLGVQSSLFGGKALVGRTGYLGNVFGEAFLDTPNDRGENLLIVSITTAASHEIAMSDGLTKYNVLMRRVWDLMTANVKLATDGTEGAAAKIAANTAEYRKILANPFFTGIQTYTHPFKKLKTLGGQIERLFELNPRTPYSLKLYADVINFGLYDRHQNYQLRKCMNTRRP